MPDDPTPPATPPPAEPAEPPADPQPPTTPAAPIPPAADEPLGDAGKRALDAERTARKAAESDLKTLRAELDGLKTSQMTDQEKAVDAARKEGESAATAKVHHRLFAAEAKVGAAGKLQDPSLLADPDVALRLLGFTEVPTDAAGDIDTEAISGAIDKLVETRPYLAGTGATPSPGSADGGARGTGTPPTVADQITAAEKAGDWTTAGRLKSQQLMELHTKTT